MIASMDKVNIFFEKNLKHFYNPISIYDFIALFFHLWAIRATMPSHNIEQRYLHIKKVTKSLILAPDHKSFLPKVITDTRTTMEDSNLWYAIQIPCVLPFALSFDYDLHSTLYIYSCYRPCSYCISWFNDHDFF